MLDDMIQTEDRARAVEDGDVSDAKHDLDQAIDDGDDAAPATLVGQRREGSGRRCRGS
ncbi:MAG: hypothetical protein MZW92_07815 [Comamonadaceae bacterium]|nr:hypothetical protein [Comamonadaceae bacterium]